MSWIFLLVVTASAVALISAAGGKGRHSDRLRAVAITDAGILISENGCEALRAWNYVVRVELALRSRAKSTTQARSAWRMWPLTVSQADTSPSTFKTRYSFNVYFEIDGVTGIGPDPVAIPGGSGEDTALLANAHHLKGFDHTLVLRTLTVGRTATVTCFQR